MMATFIKKIVQKTAGISSIEYALIAALVAIAIIVGATLLGNNMNESISESSVRFSGAVNQ